MSFQEKNISVTLASFTLILIFFSIRIAQMLKTDSFTSANVIGLWVVVIIFAIVVTVIGMILTHAVSAAVIAIKTGDDDPDYEDFEDERDKLINLKGTNVTYTVASLGTFLAMLTFVFGLEPLVMFTLLIFFGVLAQVVGDIARLVLYRRGF